MCYGLEKDGGGGFLLRCPLQIGLSATTTLAYNDLLTSLKLTYP